MQLKKLNKTVTKLPPSTKSFIFCRGRVPATTVSIPAVPDPVTKTHESSGALPRASAHSQA